MKKFANLLVLMGTVSLSLFVVGCDGGAGTSENTTTSGPPSFAGDHAGDHTHEHGAEGGSGAVGGGVETPAPEGDEAPAAPEGEPAEGEGEPAGDE